MLQPVPGGGIPATHAAIEVKMVFKDGGAFDFHSNFERIKEKLQQAVETARESGAMIGDGSETGTGRGGGSLASINMTGVHLEELPAYDGPPEAFVAMAPQESTRQQHPNRPADIASSARQDQNQAFQPPREPPPGYDEAQQQSVANELERRLSGS